MTDNPYALRYAQLQDVFTDVRDHLPRFVRLVRAKQAQKVIELGVRNGTSTLAFLYALHDTGGKLWSVDCEPYGNFPSEMCPQSIAPDEHFDDWIFVLGMSLDEAAIAQLPDDADIVFIDTVHDYDHTLAELNRYEHKLSPHGVFILHDTEWFEGPGPNADGKLAPARYAVDDFCAEHPNAAASFFTDSYGLGVVALDGDLPNIGP